MVAAVDLDELASRRTAEAWLVRPAPSLGARDPRGVSDVRRDDVELGFDGLLVRLPPDSDEIEIDRLRD